MKTIQIHMEPCEIIWKLLCSDVDLCSRFPYPFSSRFSRQRGVYDGTTDEDGAARLIRDGVWPRVRSLGGDGYASSICIHMYALGCAGIDLCLRMSQFALSHKTI